MWSTEWETYFLPHHRNRASALSATLPHHCVHACTCYIVRTRIVKLRIHISLAKWGHFWEMGTFWLVWNGYWGLRLKLRVRVRCLVVMVRIKVRDWGIDCVLIKVQTHKFPVSTKNKERNKTHKTNKQRQKQMNDKHQWSFMKSIYGFHGLFSRTHH